MNMSPISRFRSEERLLLPSDDELEPRKCCKIRCIDNISEDEIERMQHRFASKTRIEPNQFLIDSFQLSTSGDDSLSRKGPDGMIEGKNAYVAVALLLSLECLQNDTKLSTICIKAV